MAEQRFPVLSSWQWERGLPKEVIAKLPRSVPWSFVASHEKQAEQNHRQSLSRLAERGGLSAVEMWCVMHDKRLNETRQMTDREVAEWLISLSTSWSAPVRAMAPGRAMVK